MALKEMMKICGEVRKQWAVTKVVILHRIVRYYNMYFFVFYFSFGVGEMGDGNSRTLLSKETLTDLAASRHNMSVPGSSLAIYCREVGIAASTLHYMLTCAIPMPAAVHQSFKQTNEQRECALYRKRL